MLKPPKERWTTSIELFTIVFREIIITIKIILDHFKKKWCQILHLTRKSFIDHLKNLILNKKHLKIILYLINLKD